MLLNIVENLELTASGAEAWGLLRDTQRLARLIPGVQSVDPLECPGREAYLAQVMEKVGPFKVTMRIEVAVTETVEMEAMGATLRGADAGGRSRATGALRVELTPSVAGKSMRMAVNVEVLGKLAALGAPVIRRRVTELFSEFGQRVMAEFEAAKA